VIKGGWKSIVFLGAIGAVLGWEIFASWDGDETSSPLTDLIVTYVPAEVTTVILGGLIVWLPVHFAIRYYRKTRRQRDDDVGGS